MKIRNKKFVVTGGGSGMGRELALQLVDKGATVAIVDIHANDMDLTRELSNDRDRIFTYLVDISDKDQVFTFAHDVINDLGHIDGIINNAGIIQPFLHVNNLELETIEKVMNVNFYGTLYMIKAFLPHLKTRPEAYIANVSSMGGFIPFPGQTMYSASKGAVKLMTEGLYGELKNTNIHVTGIYPGAVDTDITKNSGVDMGDIGDDAAASRALPADKAAEMMIRAIEKNKFRVLVGSDARFLDFIYRLNPGRAVRFIVKQMGKLVKDNPEPPKKTANTTKEETELAEFQAY